MTSIGGEKTEAVNAYLIKNSKGEGGKNRDRETDRETDRERVEREGKDKQMSRSERGDRPWRMVARPLTDPGRW